MPTRRFFQASLPLRNLPWPLRWGGAITLVLAFAGFRWWMLGPAPAIPFLLFFPPIILASVFLDRGSGFVAVAVSTCLTVYLFIPPHFQFALPTTMDTVSVGLFLMTGLFIACVTEALHLAYVSAEKAQQDAQVARKQAEAGEHERDLLLEEFAHRVKNDLQRITATITLQAAGATPAVADALDAVADRIRVVSRVHDRLARRDGHVQVDARDFLHDLLADLRASTADLRPIGLFVEAEPHMLSVSRASAVGLIVDELVTNALKHAFPDDRAGAVRVRFRRDGADYVVTVADDGIGSRLEPIGQVREVPARSGIGRRLVRALAAQLEGRIETSEAEPSGTAHTLRFPVRASDGYADACGERATPAGNRAPPHMVGA